MSQSDQHSCEFAQPHEEMGVKSELLMAVDGGCCRVGSKGDSVSNDVV